MSFSESFLLESPDILQEEADAQRCWVISPSHTKELAGGSESETGVLYASQTQDAQIAFNTEKFALWTLLELDYT